MTDIERITCKPTTPLSYNQTRYLVQISFFQELVFSISRSVSPVLIPMIDALGSLQLDDILDREESVFEYE